MRKTVSEIQEIKREQALADIREMVDRGSLVIRQMTDEERARYGRRGTARNRAGRAR